MIKDDEGYFKKAIKELNKTAGKKCEYSNFPCQGWIGKCHSKEKTKLIYKIKKGE